MLLSDPQKQALIARYMPILLVASDDLGLPVDPELFVNSSALWSSRRPQLDEKANWGLSGDSGRRDPIIPRGALSLADLPLAERRGKDFEEFWLDCAGWRDAADVAPSKDNRQANLEALKASFVASPPVLRAEVCDEASWAAIGSARSTLAVLGLEGEAIARKTNELVVINYMFLFAGHREEEVTETFSDGMKYNAADYEGDWACFSVVLTADYEVGQEHLEGRFAGYWRSKRGQSSSFGENRTHAGFEILGWDVAPRIGDEACIACAIGTHNLYPADVPTTAEDTVQIQSGSGGFGENIISAIIGWVQKAVKKNTHTSAAVLGVTIAKMAAGAAVAGPFGALGGLVAGVMEAGPIGKAIGKDPGLPEIDPSTTRPPDGKLKDPKDKFKSQTTGSQKLVLVASDPDAVSDAAIGQFITFEGTVDRRAAWYHNSFKPVDRDAEPFWPLHDSAAPKGYVGRWGVRCERDEFNRRGGGILPDFRVEILRNLMVHFV